MQTKFRVVSLSHKSAPVHIRELISLDELAIERLLLKLKEFFSVADALILSTCNRTEVYYSHESDLSIELIKLIGIERGLANAISYFDYFQVLNEEQEAVTHLFRVSMGLEAQVVGDIQILNQVKRAYQTAADLELAGPFLHRLMHTIFFTNKRAVQETAFRDGAASLSYATIELIESLTQNIFQPRILLIGVGEIGEDVARNMVHLPTAQLKITNRTLAKAEEIGGPLGFEVIPFESCLTAIEEADVVNDRDLNRMLKQVDDFQSARRTRISGTWPLVPQVVISTFLVITLAALVLIGRYPTGPRRSLKWMQVLASVAVVSSVWFSVLSTQDVSVKSYRFNVPIESVLSRYK
jgi:glutamyl-tRNA reductase